MQAAHVSTPVYALTWSTTTNASAVNVTTASTAKLVSLIGTIKVLRMAFFLEIGSPPSRNANIVGLYTFVTMKLPQLNGTKCNSISRAGTIY